MFPHRYAYAVISQREMISFEVLTKREPILVRLFLKPGREILMITMLCFRRVF